MKATAFLVKTHWNPYHKTKTEHIIEKDSQEQIFEEFYELNRTLRYINDEYYEWKDQEVADAYKQ